MLLVNALSLNFFKTSKCTSIHQILCLVCSQRFHSIPVLLKNKTNESESKENEVVPSLKSSRYESFSEKNAPIILDIVEERNKVKDTFEEKFYDEFHGINLKRGVNGVFDIEELVDILRKEKAENIFVAAIPEEFRYADYMVVVTGRSSRHMLAMCEFIRKVFKRKRCESDIIPILEGKNSKNWIALDLGNIVLHVFEKTSRELYDLETLWSVGKEYDTQLQTKDLSIENIMSDYTKILASLTPNTIDN